MDEIVVAIRRRDDVFRIKDNWRLVWNPVLIPMQTLYFHILVSGHSRKRPRTFSGITTKTFSLFLSSRKRTLERKSTTSVQYLVFINEPTILHCRSPQWFYSNYSTIFQCLFCRHPRLVTFRNNTYMHMRLSQWLELSKNLLDFSDWQRNEKLSQAITRVKDALTDLQLKSLKQSTIRSYLS